jgi:hypothetical protein
VLRLAQSYNGFQRWPSGSTAQRKGFGKRQSRPDAGPGILNPKVGVIMNLKHFLAGGAALIVAGSTFAQELVPSGDAGGAAPASTRAQLMQQLRAGAASGGYLVGGREFADPAANFVSSRSRAQARLDLQSSRVDGSYSLAHREYVDPAAGFAPGRSRARVLAELRQSRADGSYALAHQEYPGQVAQRGSHAGFRLARSDAASPAD